MKTDINFNSIFNTTNDSFLKNLLKINIKYFEDTISFIDSLNDKLEEDFQFRQNFCYQLHSIFRNITFRKFLLDVGILEENSLFSVFFKRIGYAILPQIEDDHTLTSLANSIFYDEKNYHKLKIIPKDRWIRFFRIIIEHDNSLLNIPVVQIQITDSISILMDRISGAMNEPEMLRLSKSLGNPNRPIKLLAQNIRKNIDKSNISFDVLEIKNLINLNNQFLDDILNQKTSKGISLRVTVVITKLRQQLQRLQVLINSHNDLKTQEPYEFLARITKNWLDFYSPKNKIVKQFTTTIYLLTFIVTNYNGITGEKYITSSAKEYFKMLFSASGGGFIVAILCFIKLHLSLVPNSTPLAHAIGYSLNYAIGFVIIYLLHFTLATKQPAMTAARISQAISSDPDKQIDYKEFSNLFARLFRSQFIAFLGNVGMCIPIALIIFWFLTSVLNIYVISPEKASIMMSELTDPDYTIFWYGAVAGVFLFMSGLVSGLAINHTRYYNILDRIYHHPFLVKILNDKNRKKVVSSYEKHIGGIIGNVVLGILLGSAFLIGKFTGFPFDIRHITFAAGNFAIALSGLQFSITNKDIIIAIVSIFGIGGFNFIISFSLSLIVALKSNQIPLINLTKLLYKTFLTFLKNPLPFFFPNFKNKNEIIL